jgi:hypothetical protein
MNYEKKYMTIKQELQFESKGNDYSYIGGKVKGGIRYISIFFHDAYFYVQRAGIINYINELYIPDGYGECNMMYEMVTITIDIELDIIYLHGDATDFIKTIEDLKLQKFYYDELLDLDLCKNNILPHAAMTKDNFVHILTKWDQLWNQKPPYILLYQNDQDWYELEPFETQESMEQFVADHAESK